MQITDGRLILTWEMSKNKNAKTSKIYLNKFARNFGLQHKPSSGAEREVQVQAQVPLRKVCVANRNIGQIFCLNIFYLF